MAGDAKIQSATCSLRWSRWLWNMSTTSIPAMILSSNLKKGAHMPSLEFTVYCKCGYGLCRKTEVDGAILTIEPCPSCLSEAEEKGYDRGFEEGRESDR
jgi:hypothetical protein